MFTGNSTILLLLPIKKFLGQTEAPASCPNSQHKYYIIHKTNSDIGTLLLTSRRQRNDGAALREKKNLDNII